MGKFTAKVSAFARKTEQRLDAVFKTAVLMVIEEAQRPVALGGRMRIDTGFLRASGRVSLEGMPSGPSRPGAQAISAEDAALAIAQAPAGAPIWFGWTASYARPREYYDGFLSNAVGQWPAFVNKAARDLKERLA